MARSEDHRPSPLQAYAYAQGDAGGLTIEGDIDISAVPALESAIDDAIRETEGAFVLDLSTVGFMDSSGLRLVLRARSLLARDERALAVIAPDGPVRRLFDVVGVADLLLVFDTRDDVSAHLVPAGR